ncbi:MAG: nucleoside transporter C-terminal domain-containing protein [Bacteroidia bacterium]
MQNLTGILGIILILGVAYLLSNNKKAIDYRLVFSGIGLQIFLGLLILKVAPVTRFFGFLGHCMDKLGALAKEGANFVYGGISMTGYTGAPQDFRAPTSFVFAFNIPATIILVCVLVAIFYHIGLMQRVIAVIAKVMNKVMRVSGAEALSNVASAFVGQVEAQVMIRPYIATMTNSELLASMSGSMACIAGSILIVYVSMGVPAAYLLTASLMAAPGALVISKIIYPETEESQTKGDIKLEVKSPYTNIIDAISHGASDGMKIAINVIAMLIGFIALIALINFILGLIYPGFSLDVILGWIFYPFAWAMGVPQQDVLEVATLMGKKLSINEFVAYSDLTRMNATAATALTSKATMVASFALCGFANFSSVGMQIGGISELAPSRRADLAKLGFKALIAGTLASYLSATIAGLLFDVIPTIDPSTWF